jgi:iron complex transport system substrate-binding protein
MSRWAERIILVVLFALGCPALAAPGRVVSIHLCADQFVLGLADRAQIAAVSWLARDSAHSYMANRVGELPETRGGAEEVIALRPDLVIAGAYSARATVRLLRSLGVPVHDLKLPASFAEIRQEVLAVAEMLGHPARGRALVADMEQRLAAAARARPVVRPSAILYQPGGVTMGAGLLEDDIIRRAGFDNIAARLGLVGPGTVGLERLVLAAPDLVVFGEAEGAPPSLSTRLFDHPALARAAPGARRMALAPRLWTCGAWFTVEAVEALGRARDANAADQ